MTRQRHTRGSTGAFTLVELLVVISVITILLSLLMPTLASARKQGRMVRELAASRQLGQAYIGYALDHNGSLMPGHFVNSEPALDERGNPLSPLEVANRWPWRLVRYINYGLFGSLLVNEQEEELADRASSIGFTYEVSLYPSFGLNFGNLGGDQIAPARNLPGWIKKVEEASKPSRLIVFASAGATGPSGVTYGYWRLSAPTKPYEFSASGWTTEDYHFPYSGPPDKWGWVHPRWDNRAIVSHLDGHSESLAQPELRDMTRWSNRAAQLGDPNWIP